jgi:hypothetical protein
VALAILLVAAPAMAHSDTGNMTVEVAEGDDSLHPASAFGSRMRTTASPRPPPP